MNNTQGITQTLQGHYKVGVVNAATEEIHWTHEGHNLVLNAGMDNLYNMSVADQLLYGICGTGTRPNNQFSGLSQISQSGNTVLLCNTSGNITNFSASFDVYPTLVQVGDMISCSLGQQLTVTSVNSNGVNLTVTPSYTFSSQSFAVYKTTQTGLQLEISRSNTYQPGLGSCGTTFTGSTAVHRRSYNFPVLVTNQSYNEVGVGWESSGPGNTFSRILLNTPLIVNAGFYLRLIYDLSATYASASTSGSISIGGWSNTNATQSVQTFLGSYVDVDGDSQNALAVLDPYFLTAGDGLYAGIFVSSNSSSLAPFGSAVDRSAVSGLGPQMSKATYTNGTYYCDRTGNTISGSSLLVNSFGFGVSGNLGYSAANTLGQAYCVVLNNSQSLLNTQTITLTFRTSWNRILG